jgi:2-C-methyl-D-erythritol 2,4-cyclodiphosphate synthase
VFLRESLDRVRRAGYRLSNLDCSLILAAPKIGPHSVAIRQRVAELLGIPSDCVGLKAKTPEGLNLENTAVAHVVVLLETAGKISVSRKSRKKLGTRGKKR